MDMNRKGFLKRIAGAIGLVAVGKEVAAKAELECGYRVRYMSTEEYDEKFPRHTGIDLAEAKDFDVRCEEQRLADKRFCDVQGSQWEDKPFPFKREERPKFEVSRVRQKLNTKYQRDMNHLFSELLEDIRKKNS